MIILLKNSLACLSLAILVSSISYAGTQKIAYITNQEDSDVIDLMVVTNKRADATHLKMIHRHSNGKVYATHLYSSQKVTNGVVIYEQKNRDIVKLKSNNFSSHQGGDIKLDYLINGITGHRGKLYLDLSRDGDIWSLKQNYKKIKRMHFISNKKTFIGTIGIKRIEAK